MANSLPGIATAGGYTVRPNRLYNYRIVMKAAWILVSVFLVIFILLFAFDKSKGSRDSDALATDAILFFDACVVASGCIFLFKLNLKRLRQGWVNRLKSAGYYFLEIVIIMIPGQFLLPDVISRGSIGEYRDVLK